MTPEHRAQARQLRINAEKIARQNKIACASIDRETDYAISRRSTTGIGKDRKDGVTKYHAPTIHDAAASNPAIRAMLLRIQRKYIP